MCPGTGAAAGRPWLGPPRPARRAGPPRRGGRQRAIARGRPAPVPCVPACSRTARRPAREQQSVRRTAGNASAARIAAGKGATAGGDPNHRVRASKPGVAQFPRSSSPGAIAVTESDPAAWVPEHELAPGLHLVATPIGNLGDVTLRALWVLRNVDRILCEDTRVTGRLLARFGIDTPLDPYHDHNADRVRPAVLEALRRGERRALVSDAGTPLVSDPGFKLVRAAPAEDLPVTAAPGPSAAMPAPILF